MSNSTWISVLVSWRSELKSSLSGTTQEPSRRSILCVSSISMSTNPYNEAATGKTSLRRCFFMSRLSRGSLHMIDPRPNSVGLSQNITTWRILYRKITTMWSMMITSWKDRHLQASDIMQVNGHNRQLNQHSRWELTCIRDSRVMLSSRLTGPSLNCKYIHNLNS